jgi:beta-galactosidase GanA
VKGQPEESMFSLYSSAQVGILGAIVRKTNIEKILQLNCNATDFYQKNSFPTYLYYNPYDSLQTVCYNNYTKEAVDLYDALLHEWVTKDVATDGCFEIAAKSARLIVVLPTGSKIKQKEGKYLVGTKIVAYANGTTR